MLFLIAGIVTLLPNINSALALIIGLVTGYFLGHPFPKHNSQVVSNLLKIAVVGLAFGMNWQETLTTGMDSIGLTICFITLTVGTTMLLSRQLKLPDKLSYLLGIGTAICGGSAIATVTPIISATEKDISISIGVVFLLNAIALLLFPMIGQWLGLSQDQFGTWAAIAIHDTSSVVGAASIYGNEALQVATTVKLVRALWIVPVAVFSVLVFKSKNRNVRLPWFIFLFIAVVFAKGALPISATQTGYIVHGAKSLMVLALFFVGSSLPGIDLKTLGWKALALGIALWLLVSVASLLLILN